MTKTWCNVWRHDAMGKISVKDKIMIENFLDHPVQAVVENKEAQLK